MLRKILSLESPKIISPGMCWHSYTDNVPEVLAAQERPASLKAAMPLMVARRMPHRNMATGSMPMSCLTYARSLLRSNATMSGRMWSVFFSRKSWWGRTYQEHCERHHQVYSRVIIKPFCLCWFSVWPPYLDLIFDFPSKVSNDEGRLHDWCGNKVLVPLVLLLEFG